MAKMPELSGKELIARANMNMSKHKLSIRETLSSSQQARYSGRPEVNRSTIQEVFICDGHANEIIEKKLYLGDFISASEPMNAELQSLNVTGIVNCTMDSKSDYFHPNIEYIRVAINDNESAHIDPYFSGCCDFIAKHINNGGGVLVHCQAGSSRSSSIVIAYLMKCHHFSLHNAFILSKQRRSLTSPNVGFWKQLECFENVCQQEQLQEHDSDQAEEANEMIFDESWCRQSCAEFNMDRGKRTANTLSQCNSLSQQKVLDSGLDFVLGRGILTSDVKWLKFVCEILGFEKSINYLHETMFVDSSGDFMDTWCCEFKQPILRKFLIDLGANENSPLFLMPISEC